MRKLNLLLVLVVVLSACAHQPIAGRHPAGIERSVLPIFVTEYARTEYQIATGAGFKTKATSNFRACVGVYVAPHLLATRVSVFPPEHDGVTMYDPESISILAGAAWLRASDVPFFDPETGLVLIRTDWAGVPLTLWDGPLAPTDELKRIGFIFRLSPMGILANPSWDVGPAATNDTFDFLSSIAMFRVRTNLRPDNGYGCGSAIIGRDGTLAGIISRGIRGKKNEATVIGPALIRAAIESLK